ncbi:lysophospholipid acyltransferase family protein [Microbacterium candidum]|uniref:lysophospholipid acyltransferase family protein n=1 Tax=Microbacterium candidum TaxID=3041922 RepID=UPI003B02EC36
MTEADTSASGPSELPEDDDAEPRTAGFLYGLIRFILVPLVRVLYRPHIEGRHNVPKHGAVIFASNHLSFIDSIVIPVASPRKVHFLAKSSYFEGTGFKGWVNRELFLAIGASPIRRGAGQAALDALGQSRRMLEAGQATAMYPEGTRSLDGRLYKGRTGVAFLALQTGAPVVPVGLVNTDKIMPVGAKFPRLRPRIAIRFGEPLDLTKHGTAESGKARRLATDEIMSSIHALSGQELANAYNEAPAHGIDRIKQVLPHERL